MPTHFDLFVVMTVFSCFGFCALAFLFWLAWKIHTEARKSQERGERMTRAVAGLVVQETEKIRELMRD
jgi:threonine/homoserine/homoserine lactone efflux protein